MTSREFALLLGVSQSTVSRALNRSPLISAEKRDFICAKAREYGFELNRQAQSLKTNRTGTIGIIFPAHFQSMNQNPMLAHLYDYLQRDLIANDYDIMSVYDYLPNPEVSVLERMIRRRKLDGLIILRKSLLDRERELIHANEFPCATIYNSYGAWLNIDSALCDRKHGGYLAGRFLGQFAGYRLMFLAVEDEPESSELQCAGFRLGLAERGRELGEGSIMRCRLSFQAAYEYTMANRERFLSDKLAIHTHNDVTAIGMLTALNDLGVDIPGQVQLIGTDDIFLATWTRPQLSTIHVRAEEIVAEASRLLRERIEGKKGPRRVFESKPKLALRQTTLPGDEG